MTITWRPCNGQRVGDREIADTVKGLAAEARSKRARGEQPMTMRILGDTMLVAVWAPSESVDIYEARLVRVAEQFEDPTALFAERASDPKPKAELPKPEPTMLEKLAGIREVIGGLDEDALVTPFFTHSPLVLALTEIVAALEDLERARSKTP